jgi:tetratricopeptide (TPR) repeat protein
VRLRYGMLLKLVGRWHEAAEAFEQSTRQNPGYVEAWVQLAVAKREIGDAPGAMEALEQAIQIKPEYADLHYRLGLIYCSEMEFDLAMERMEEAVSLNRQNPDFQRHLWVALQGLQLTGHRRASADQDERTHEMTSEVAPD